MLANGEGTGHVYEFLQAFNGLTGSSVTPWSVVGTWESFVAECEEGYHQNEYEYRYDCRWREVLEKALYAPEMDPFPEQIRAMKKRVFDADERLRALFIPGFQIDYPNWDWWERGVLRNGIGEYAEDMKRNYGVDLENPPNRV